MAISEFIKESDQSNLKALLDMGVYESEDDYIHETLMKLLKSNKELRIKLAMHRYQTEPISVGKAAEIAGVCWDDMKQILMKNGIRPRLGPQTIEEAKEEILSTERVINAMKEESGE
jgi:predicted HTH domain antitoxin